MEWEKRGRACSLRTKMKSEGRLTEGSEVGEHGSSYDDRCGTKWRQREGGRQEGSTKSSGRASIDGGL